MVFPVVMYGCESWTIKKTECRRIDAFELWFWRRLLRVPWTARRSNQSILKEINLEYSSKELMLKLKLQYFGYLIRSADSLQKTLMLGKIEGKRRRWRQRMRWLDSITNSMDVNVSKLRETVEDREAWCVAIHWVIKSWSWLRRLKEKPAGSQAGKGFVKALELSANSQKTRAGNKQKHYHDELFNPSEKSPVWPTLPGFHV